MSAVNFVAELRRWAVGQNVISNVDFATVREAQSSLGGYAVSTAVNVRNPCFSLPRSHSYSVTLNRASLPGQRVSADDNLGGASSRKVSHSPQPKACRNEAVIMDTQGPTVSSLVRDRSRRPRSLSQLPVQLESVELDQRTQSFRRDALFCVSWKILSRVGNHQGLLRPSLTIVEVCPYTLTINSRGDCFEGFKVDSWNVREALLYPHSYIKQYR